MLSNQNNFKKILNHMTKLLCVFSALMLFIASPSFADSALNDVKYNTLTNNELELMFIFDETIAGKPSITAKSDPTRIEIEFTADNFPQEFSNILINRAGVEHVAIQKYAGKVLVSIALQKMKLFKTTLDNNTFKVILFNNEQQVSASTESEFLNSVELIDFQRGEKNEANVLVHLNDNKLAVEVSERLGKIYVEFHNTNIPEELLALLDVSDFGTLVSQIETFKVGLNTRLIIETTTAFTFKHQQNGNVFVLTVTKDDKKAGFLTDSKTFTGKAISLNFQDISVRTVLQIIAEYNGFNLVTTDSVSGNITLRLDGTPWDQALDIILKVKGLDKRMEGNILMVAPSEELAAREARELQAQQQVTDLAPLHSEYIQINYAKAVDFVGILKNKDTSILSTRGSVTVDERTNTLLIRDTAKSIKDIKRMIDVLDVPVRQVVIESRMVTVKDNISDSLGIRWGVTQNSGTTGSAGTLAGAGNAANGVIPSLNDRLNVNLPASQAVSSLAFQVARLADGTILDLELSAMEKENKGEIIASPRITTANQKEAYIEQGTEIPYVQAASSGATTVTFKKAILGLRVTPQITPDNRVILDLVITQDTRGDTVSTATGDAVAIDTQEIGTQVLVNNGETIVLGGIYQQQIINSVSKVPVLGDIPYFGWLFRNSTEFNEKKELLIFVTPRIITEEF